MPAFSAANAYGRKSRARIDNFVFRLNYQATVVLLLTAAVIFRLHGQNAISCSSSNERSVPDDVFNDYCLYRHQFAASMTSPPDMDEAILIGGVPRLYPRMPPNYLYLWPLLFWLAITFYVPHWLWVNYENGRMTRLVNQLLYRQGHFRDYRIRDPWYGFVYYSCEVLNFAVALSQFFALDVIMGGAGRFINYGSKYIYWRQRFDEEPALNPERHLFPLQVACSYRLDNVHGRSNIEEVCVLPQNALNSKIYLCVWAWLVLMICCNSAVIFYRVVMFLCSQSIRRRWLFASSNNSDARWGLLGICLNRLVAFDEDVKKSCPTPGGDTDLQLNMSNTCQLTFLLANIPWMNLELFLRSANTTNTIDFTNADNDNFEQSENRGDVKLPLMQRGDQETSA